MLNQSEVADVVEYNHSEPRGTGGGRLRFYEAVNARVGVGLPWWIYDSEGDISSEQYNQWIEYWTNVADLIVEEKVREGLTNTAAFWKMWNEELKQLNLNRKV